MFGTILKQWINAPEAQILSDILPLDTTAPAENYWTVPNFDMAFL